MKFCTITCSGSINSTSPRSSTTSRCTTSGSRRYKATTATSINRITAITYKTVRSAAAAAKVEIEARINRRVGRRTRWGRYRSSSFSHNPTHTRPYAAASWSACKCHLPASKNWRSSTRSGSPRPRSSA